MSEQRPKEEQRTTCNGVGWGNRWWLADS